MVKYRDMRRVSVFLVFFFLCQFCSLSPISRDSNPAYITNNYYPAFGFSISEKSKKLTELPLNNWSLEGRYYKPSRLGYATLHSSTFSQHDINYRLIKAKRKSAFISYGGGVGAGYDYHNKKAQFEFEPGVIYRYTGNWHFGLYDRLTVGLDKSNNLHIENKLCGQGKLQFNQSHLLLLEMNSTPEVELIYSHTEGKISIDTGIGLRHNKYTPITGKIAIAYKLGKEQLEVSGSKKSFFDKSVSYDHFFGEYTPPISYAETFFPLKKPYLNRHGIVIQQAVDTLPRINYEKVVKRGDTLSKISRSLPPEVEELYKNDPNKIALYNGIKPSSPLKQGQVIRVPIKTPKIQRDYHLPLNVQNYVGTLLDSIELSNTIETRVIGGLWAYRLSHSHSVSNFIPFRADIDNLPLLNIQSLLEIESGSYKAAIRKLRFAIVIDEDSPVLHHNLGTALYLDKQYEEAKFHLHKAIELSEMYDAHLDFELAKEILRELK
jgi:hypothetical protein